MATIHHTTLTPTKLELLTGWLPRRPWYRGSGRPVLAKAGGFRLDDPAGEVGIEVAVVRDGDGTRYLVPMTYRGAPLEGSGEGLIGTSEHGVLGRRWIYDAAHDPVAVAQLLALAAGRAVAQHQDLSDTVDTSVGAVPPLAAPAEPALPPSVTEEGGRTSVALEPAGLSLQLVRVLEDGDRPGGDRPGGDQGADVVASVLAEVAGAGRQPVVLVRRHARTGS